MPGSSDEKYDAEKKTYLVWKIAHTVAVFFLQNHTQLYKVPLKTFYTELFKFLDKYMYVKNNYQRFVLLMLKLLLTSYDQK